MVWILQHLEQGHPRRGSVSKACSEPSRIEPPGLRWPAKPPATPARAGSRRWDEEDRFAGVEPEICEPLQNGEAGASLNPPPTRVSDAGPCAGLLVEGAGVDRSSPQIENHSMTALYDASRRMRVCTMAETLWPVRRRAEVAPLVDRAEHACLGCNPARAPQASSARHAAGMSLRSNGLPEQRESVDL